MERNPTFSILSLAAIGGDSPTLSLKEKQAIAALDFSWAQKRISGSYGSAVPVALDAPSFAGDMDAISYAATRGADVAANAIAAICDDALGKEALQGKKLTKIILVNKADAKPALGLSDGTLTLAIGFSSSDNYFSDRELKDAIEGLL